MSRENLAFSFATTAGIVLLFVVGLSRRDLLVEDGLVESLGAAGFAAASVLALYVTHRKWALLTLVEKSALFGTTALSSMALLSEISFGARILDIQMPQMRGGGEFDGGHDIAIILVRGLSEAGSVGILSAAVGGALLLVIAAVLLWVLRQKAQVAVAYALGRTFEFRLTMAVGMLASAVLLDTMAFQKAAVLEEVLEFSASGVLILAVLGLLRQTEDRMAVARVR